MANSRWSLETRALTEGAVMAALTAILALAGIYMPVLGLLAALVWTLPVVAICLRHGMRAGLLCMIAAALIILIVSSPVTALTLVIPCAGPALLLGQVLRRKWPTGRTILLTTITTAFCMLLSLGLAAFLTGISPWEDWLMLKESMLKSFEALLPVYESMGVLQQMGISQEEFLAQMTATLELLQYLLPALLFLSALLSAAMNYVLSHQIFRRLKMDLPPMGRFYQFRQPWWQIWGLIFSFAAALFLPRALPQLTLLNQLVSNILIFYVILYFLQGTAVYVFYTKKCSRLTAVLLRIILLFALLTGNLLVLLALVIGGVVDAFADFRKLETKA